MEEIIQILIFVGAMVIAVVGQNTKGRKKPAMPSSGEVLEDVFPDIETMQEAVETLSPQPVRPEVKTPRRTFRQAKPESRRTASDTPPPSSPKPARKVSIGTREEARRAFIHSEIFNRKY